jgi:hypothetical protein
MVEEDVEAGGVRALFDRNAYNGRIRSSPRCHAFDCLFALRYVNVAAYSNSRRYCPGFAEKG